MIVRTNVVIGCPSEEVTGRDRFNFGADFGMSFSRRGDAAASTTPADASLLRDDDVVSTMPAAATAAAPVVAEELGSSP